MPLKGKAYATLPIRCGRNSEDEYFPAAGIAAERQGPANTGRARTKTMPERRKTFGHIG